MNSPPNVLDPSTFRPNRGLNHSAKVVTTLGVGIITSLNLWLYTFMMPKFEKMFDQMIPGGPAKLPFLAHLAVDWSRLSPLPQLLFLGIAVGASFLLWKKPSTPLARGASIFVVLALTIHFLITAAACFLPLISMIRHLEQT